MDAQNRICGLTLPTVVGTTAIAGSLLSVVTGIALFKGASNLHLASKIIFTAAPLVAALVTVAAIGVFGGSRQSCSELGDRSILRSNTRAGF